MISRLQKLEKVQNKCLRGVTGGYQRKHKAALETETRAPLLGLYMELTAIKVRGIIVCSSSAFLRGPCRIPPKSPPFAMRFAAGRVS